MCERTKNKKVQQVLPPAAIKQRYCYHSPSEQKNNTNIIVFYLYLTSGYTQLKDSRILQIMQYFHQLEPLLQMFWFIAIPVSIIFIIQSVMTFMGADAHDGQIADFDGDLGDTDDVPFQLFSFRNLINFLIGFSWAGISFYKIVSSKVLLIALAVIVGMLFIILFFLIMKQLMKLAENNSFRIEETKGKSAQIYIRIPGNKDGKGKIQISIRGSVHEIDAVTNGPELPSGAMVKVISIIDDNLVLVEKLS